MTMTKMLCLLLLLAPITAYATETRVRALDGGLGLAADDADSALYPQALVAEGSRMTVDYAGGDTGAAGAWAAFPIWGYGNLGLWYRKPLAQQGLWDALAASGPLVEQGLGQPQASADTSSLLARPQPLAGASYALLFGRLSLGAGASFAESKALASSQGLASQGLLGHAYGVDSAYGGGLTMSAYDDLQSSQALGFNAGVGWNSGEYNVNLAGDLGSNRLNNHHQEAYAASSSLGLDQGQDTLSVEDKGAWSYSLRGRAATTIEGHTLVLTGSYGRWDLGSKAFSQASFSGATLLPAQQGWDAPLWDQSLVLEPWKASLGWATKLNPKTVFLLAAGAQGFRSTTDLLQYQQASGGGPAQQTLASEQQSLTDSLSVPVVAGLEADAWPWLTVRAAATLYAWQQSQTGQALRSYGPTGALTASSSAESINSGLGSWDCVLGLGFHLGQFTWDHSLDIAQQPLTALAYHSSLEMQW
jgi:hypothetical protein